MGKNVRFPSLYFVKFLTYKKCVQGFILLIFSLSESAVILVQFWTPLLSRNAGKRRVQDHLSAHACAKPIVAHTTSTCLFHREIQKLARKLFQHASGKNVGERSYDAEKTCQTELKELQVCVVTTQINVRAVISNPAGKTNLGKNFQAYCKYGIVFRKDSPLLFTRYLRSFLPLPS